MTKFYIKNTFRISECQSIVFEGEIIQGTINKGQTIRLTKTDHHPALNLIISSVEFVDHIGDKKANIGLTVHVEQEADLDTLLKYEIKDETCVII